MHRGPTLLRLLSLKLLTRLRIDLLLDSASRRNTFDNVLEDSLSPKPGGAREAASGTVSHTMINQIILQRQLSHKTHNLLF